MDSLEKNLPILVVNGATLLIVVMVLIRVLARVIDRVAGYLTSGLTELKVELVALRKDIRDVGHENAVALGSLTERVSRIEGKIAGIALSRPEISDEEDDRTPVGVPVPVAPTKHRNTPPPGTYRVTKPKPG